MQKRKKRVHVKLACGVCMRKFNGISERRFLVTMPRFHTICEIEKAPERQDKKDLTPYTQTKSNSALHYYYFFFRAIQAHLMQTARIDGAFLLLYFSQMHGKFNWKRTIYIEIEIRKTFFYTIFASGHDRFECARGYYFHSCQHIFVDFILASESFFRRLEKKKTPAAWVMFFYSYFWWKIHS